MLMDLHWHSQDEFLLGFVPVASHRFHRSHPVHSQPRSSQLSQLIDNSQQALLPQLIQPCILPPITIVLQVPTSTFSRHTTDSSWHNTQHRTVPLFMASCRKQPMQPRAGLTPIRRPDSRRRPPEPAPSSSDVPQAEFHAAKSGDAMEGVPGKMHLAHSADFAQPQLVCQADPVHHVPAVGQLHEEAELLACMSPALSMCPFPVPVYADEAVGQMTSSNPFVKV